MYLSGSLLHNWGTQMLTLMILLTSPSETTCWKDLSCPEVCCLRGKDDGGKVRMFLFPTSNTYKHIFPPPVVCWKFFSANLDFHKGSFVHWLFKVVFFRISWITPFLCMVKVRRCICHLMPCVKCFVNLSSKVLPLRVLALSNCFWEDLLLYQLCY